MAWIILVFAGLFEVAWALGLKHTNGFTRLWPSVYTLSTMAVSIYLLSLAVARLPTGTAYAIWTGIGAAGTAIFGMIYFNEPRDLARIGCIVLILMGVSGLKAFSPRPSQDEPLPKKTVGWSETPSQN